MSQQYINIGATPNDGLGDPIRTAFQKTNENFSELYANSGNGGNANTGNITFNNNSIIGNGNLNLQPDANDSGAYLNVYLTTGPDIHIAGNGENVIIGRDDAANITVGVNGDVQIQASTGSSPSTWTFATDGALTLPDGSGVAGGFIYGATGSAGGITNGGTGYQQFYAQDDGAFVQTSVANAGTTFNTWQFGLDGEFYLPTGGRIGATKGGTMLDGGNANSVSLTSFYGNGYYAGCFTANPDGNVSITTYTGNGVAGSWQFDNAGNLTAPGNISADGLYAGNVLAGGSYFYANSNGTSFGIVAAGGVQVDTGGIYITSTGGVNIYGVAGAQVYLGGGTSGNITVRSAINSNSTITATTYYGNGSQLTSLPAPTVTYDNTSTGYMDLMTYDGTIKYVSQATVEPSSGNIHTVGNISAVGNINSNYIFGNGTFLTGISGGGNPNANALSGNTLNANVTISSLTQLGTLGNLTVTGNTVSGNILTAGVVSSTGNAIHGNILTAGVVSSTGNAQAGNILTAGVVSSTGNAIHGNILTGGLVSATGNILATNFIGNLSNGTSRISIASSGNVSVGIGPFSTTVLNVNTSTGISVLGNVLASQSVSASGNVYSNGNIAMVSNVARNTYVANVAPTSGEGNIGDIWYQTF